MTQENLIHNSISELVITPELIDKLGVTPMIFTGEDGTEGRTWPTADFFKENGFKTMLCPWN